VDGHNFRHPLALDVHVFRPIQPATCEHLGGELGPALRRAIAQVKEGKPALIDSVTRFR